MTEWLVEPGIGETRYVRVADGGIVEARILAEGTVPAGTRLKAKLQKAGTPPIAIVGKQEYLLPKGVSGVTEGAELLVEVTREVIPGPEGWKRPLARQVLDEEEARPAPPQGQMLSLPSPADALEKAGWSDLLDEARSGVVRFDGGELRLTPTPAMTLIDVDGILAAPELAVRAARAAARAILRHSIGGSIGIDFPTAGGKADRQAIAAEMDRLLPQPFERTAVNGFGFLQVVRPRRQPSLLELASDRAAFEARALLRRAAFERPGGKRLVAHPAVIAALEAKPHWIEQLARQIGGQVALHAEPAVPIQGAYAEGI